ncbi:short-chain dehydrogenase [bacterium]|jgi:hypothetical protein|nr:short-chain dehydrogenase [bacterium]
MEIEGKRVLVLGGAGLVGMAICHKMLINSPKEIVVSSLKESEAIEGCSILAKSANGVDLIPEWGNIFVRTELKDLPFAKVLEDPELRSILIDDTLEDFSPKILEASFLYQLLHKYRPQIVVDCINSATAVAYQDIFSAGYKVRDEVKKSREEGVATKSQLDDIERMLCTMYVPQLIRHVQIFNEAMRSVKTGIYLKIGTSGTGGMGMNIPYTHSEEKPSRMLLSKTSVAGAHSSLLFVMARTPGGPIIKEIKPAAAIAWKKIAHGEIYLKGKPVELFDCPPSRGLSLEEALSADPKECWESLGRNLETAYIDTGENGIFSKGEFESISAAGQMELITPEEIAGCVVFEIRGGNTGHDIVNAMDNAVMGPTYRAGVMRASALEKLKELEEINGTDSVSFELIGPFVSKLLFEAHLVKKACGKMSELRKISALELQTNLEDLIEMNKDLRASILSVGIGILLSDGKTLLRGPQLKIPPHQRMGSSSLDNAQVDRWAKAGWVDLRPKNLELWKERIERIYNEMEAIPEEDSSSRYIRTQNYWLKDEKISVGKLVGWVLSIEEESLRMKD